MNVILVVVDTLRARNMSCYGYAKNTCPNIDAFARQGVLFENATSVVHNTHPAFTTMITGMYPITHRVVRMNGNYALEYKRFQTLAQQLQKAGYKTASIDNLESAGSMVKATWMSFGFDVRHNYSLAGKRKGKENQMMCYLNEVACDMLDQIKDSPFFMFYHCWDPHTSYLPREEFKHRWYDGDPAGRINLGYLKPAGWELADTGRTRPGMKEPDPEDLRYTVAMYDGCISDMDDAFGAFLRKLDQLGLTDDTLIILTSDHGENLDERHTYFNHRWAYDDTMRIPLIVRWPKGLPAGKRLSALAQQTDLLPTILDLAGAPAEPCADGISLGPVMRGETDTTYPFAHMHATIPDTRRAIRDARYKYIEWIDGCPLEPGWPTRELYDLQADPLETHNLMAELPAEAQRLKREMDRWVEMKLEDSKRIFGVRRQDPLIEQAWQGHLRYEGTPRWFK